VALGGATLLNCFWNGILATFILRAIRDRHWWTFLFLSMHCAFGVCIMLAWLAALLAPFWVETVTVGPEGLSKRWSVLGLGRTRKHDPWQIGRVELRRGGPSVRTRYDAWYSVVVIGSDGNDLLSIGDLTEGEARWMGAELCAALPAGRAVSEVASGPGVLWDRWLDAR
jgi:hypothetical protein